jgi:YHS domain-containing protein
MVKDPHCKTYIPKDSAIRARIAGGEYYFCSKECMKRFKGELEESRGE